MRDIRIAVIEWPAILNDGAPVTHTIAGKPIIDNDGTLGRKAQRWAACSLSPDMYDACTITLYSVTLDSSTARKVK